MDMNLYSDIKRTLTPTPQRPYTEAEVKKKAIESFTRKIKEILAADSLEQMLELFFKLEAALYTTNSEIGEDFSEPVSLKEFYRSLSPMLLRTLWDSVRAGRKSDELLRSFKEALRVALEEELYYWNSPQRLN